MVDLYYYQSQYQNQWLQHNIHDLRYLNYHQNCQRVLKDNSWIAKDLQKILDKSREYQINQDFKSWVNLHNPFFEVLNFLKELRKREIKTGIITTKGKKFAEKILKQLNIFPEFIFDTNCSGLSSVLKTATLG